MARRIESALASIFLPQDSVYAQLDNPPSPPGTSTPPPRSPPVEVQQEQEEDPDPFATSPSVLSPASRQPPLPAASSTPHSSADSQPVTRAAPHQLQDSRSPFHDEPISHSTTATASLYHDTAQHSQSRQASSPLRANPTLRATGSSLGASTMNASSIGNRSLMGLLGGTRYDPHSFEGVGAAGLGVGGEVLEEDEAEYEGEDRRRAELSLSESRAFAASLPPPPSAPSDSTSPSTSEDEDDDPAPDFTSRVPLTSSSRRRSRPSSSSHDLAASPKAHGWGGLRLGGGPTGGILGAAPRPGGAGMSARERALWRWINVEDLDGFLQQVYLYYVGKGIWALVLGRVLNLLTVGWVIFFSTFLVGCIDYSILWDSHSLHEVVVPQCVSRFSSLTTLLFLSFVAFYFWRVVRFGLGVKELWEMHEFFEELLDVQENDIQTIPWHSIVTHLSALRASHPSALSSRSTSASTTTNQHRLDAHDVANRIMREENYLIALFNKDVLDLSVPLPPFLARWKSRSAKGKRGLGEGMLTKTLEWNLGFCLVGFLFGRDGQVRRAFLLERNKKELVEALRRRFILMGLINAVFAPFIVLYLLMYSFFRYFEEYHKNPSSIGSRQFTPLARWKFREFNELPHLFSQRLALAHPLADSYVGQFPKEKTALLSRFVAFLAGSFAAVLILFSLIDPDAFLHFEVTPGRTVLFYIGVFGTVLAVARGMVPDENRVVDTEETMRRIVEHTHYLPEEWHGKLHSAEVHAAFSLLFPMKIILFLYELLSVIVTPFVLWYSLPACAGPIVDFFREFTVHVDGLGYVCSFAVFDFKRHGDARFGAPAQQVKTEDRWKSGEGKMEKSFLNFVTHNPSWVPRDQAQSLFLSKMTDNSALAPQAPGVPSSSMRHPSAHPPAHTTGMHPRFAGTNHNPHARSSSRGHRFTGGLGASIVEERSALGGGPEGGASSLPSSRLLLDPSARRRNVPPSSSSRFVGGGGLRSPPSHTAQVTPAVQEEEPIIEPSRLDGQSFIAPTQGRPFGVGSEEEQEAMGMGEIDGESSLGSQAYAAEGQGRQGLGGMLGELYGQAGGRW